MPSTRPVGTQSPRYNLRIHVAAAALSALAGLPALAQPWQRQAPWPSNRPLYSAAMTSPTHGFAVALNGTVVETQDAGDTWTTRFQQGYGTEPMYKIHFEGPLHGYISGNPGGLYNMRTTNGGQTWLPMPQLNLGSTYDLDFITPTSGFASPGGWAVAFTSDAGATWDTRLHSPAIQWWGMDFVDQNLGLVGGHEFDTQPDVFGLFRTADGGRTFTHVSDAIGFPLWLSPTEAVAIGAQTDPSGTATVFRTYRSTDAGLTWFLHAQAFAFEPESFFNVVHVGGDVFCGVSAIGTIWRTDNMGLSWNKVNQGLGIPFIANVWADISFLDSQHGWSCNSSNVMVATDDGGASWRVISQGVNGDVFGIDFADDGKFGVAACGGQIVQITGNGGQDWSVRRIATFGSQFGFSESVECVHVFDETTAYVGGDGGMLYRTTDGAETWTNIGYFGTGNFPVWASPADIEFTSPTDGWVACREGVFHTTDGGFVWNQIEDPEPNWSLIGGAIEIEGETSVFVMPDGSDILWRSTDYGQTWDHTEFTEDFVMLRDISFATPQIGWAVGQMGGNVGWDSYIARTTDGGVTWHRQYTHAAVVSFRPSLVFDIEALSPTHLKALALENDRTVVLTSHNGGVNWTKDTHPTITFPENLDQLAATPNGSVWMAGFRGLIEHKPGVAACRPDLTAAAIPGTPGYGAPNGTVNNDDFFYYLVQFAAGNLAVADMTTTAIPTAPGYGTPNGAINNDDFFYYLLMFQQGC